MQSLRRVDATYRRRLLCTIAKTLLFAIICGGLIAGSISAHGVSDDIVFPGPISSKDGPDSADDIDAPVPLKLASKLNSINTAEEFLQLLQGVPANERTFLSSRFGEEIGERSNAVRPQPAKCLPELQTVSLKLDNDSATIVYPPCTRIKRCGGCCSSSLLSCEPTASETRNFEVIISTVALRYRGRRIVPLEEHTECKCDCRIKKEHCNEKQHYSEDNCLCVCDNIDEKEKCRQNNETKLWNPELCLCSCRKIEPCHFGYYFDHNTCRCRQITFPRQPNRFAPTTGSSYNFDNAQRPENVPPVIIPLDPSDPRRKHKEDPEYK